MFFAAGSERTETGKMEDAAMMVDDDMGVGEGMRLMD